MKRNTYYPSRQGDQAVWLTNFKTKLADYAAALGLTPAQVAALVADSNWMIYLLLTWLPAARTWAQSATDALAEAGSGSGVDPQKLPEFTAPPLPDGTVPVSPGALIRIFVAVQTIKDSPKATEVICTDLGIIGAEKTAPDFTILAPVLQLSISGYQVFIKWGWGKFAAFLDSCEIQVDRNDGKGFVLLTIDTTPNYTDTHPFPSAPTKWSYRAIYRVDDQPAGVWSQPVSIIVGG
jgi:hypothetical protein